MAIENPTMTPQGAEQYLRKRGVAISAVAIRLGLQQGVFEFGDCVATGKTSTGDISYTYYIYTKLFLDWARERGIPE